MSHYQNQTPSLFGETSVMDVSRGNPRQAIIHAALAKAKAEWRERYTQFILEFAQNATEPFTAEDVREAFNAQKKVPKTQKEQASGGIFQKLIKADKLRPSGTKRSRKFGNFLAAYTKGAK